LSELEVRKVKAKTALAAQSVAGTLITLLPAATVETYRIKIADFVTTLTYSKMQNETGDAVRSLIDHIQTVPDAAALDRHQFELHGDLAACRIHG